MNLVVLTPKKKVFEGSVSSVKVPGTGGIFEVLNGHAALVSSLNAGEVRVKADDGKDMNFEIADGFIEVLNNQVALLVTGVKSL